MSDDPADEQRSDDCDDDQRSDDCDDERRRTFADFDGYDGDEDTDATADHDEWGVDK
jgi:hypothetical protein